MKSKGSNKHKSWSKQRLNAELRDFFLVSERERRGLRVLIIIILLVWGINAFLIPSLPKDKVLISAQVRSSLEAHRQTWLIANKKKDPYDERASVTISVLAPFNPNHVSPEQLEDMGFPSKLAARWCKYLKVGGKFGATSDLLRLFGFQEEWLNSLEGKLVFDPGDAPKSYAKTNGIAETTLIELNTTDSAQLLGLSGIGPAFAGRIIKYRQRLGGFLCPDQLLEVYGMDSIRYTRIQEKLITDSSSVSRMNINQLDFKSLLKHPYMTKQLAYEIVEFRRVNGRIRSISELKELVAMPAERQERLKLYLVLE